MMSEEKLNKICAYLIDNVFRNEQIMLDDEYREPVDLPEIIASLYEELHRVVTGQPYEYMFHWANKVGSWVENDLFREEGD